jgi:putative (di)nucleoside polyphosphate hydrolase
VKKGKKLLPYAERPHRDCVGLALFNRDGLVFAGRRVDDPAGYWQMPQGGIDKGEDAVTAALRELREEVGTDKAEVVGEIDHWLSYDVPAELADKVWGGRYRGQRQRWFALRFTGTDDDIDLNTHHPEFAEWQWMKLSDLPKSVIGFKRDIYSQVAAAFQKLATASR